MANEEIESPSYYDTEEFQAYCQLVLAAFEDEPLSIGELHRRLGEHTRREWTMAAISLLPLEEMWGIPARYQRQTYKAREIHYQVYGSRHVEPVEFMPGMGGSKDR